MKKFILFLLVSSFFISVTFAQVKYYNYFTQHVGPGVIHKKIIVPSVPWTLNVLEVDLTNPYSTLETAKANDRLIGLERTSSMVARKSYEGHRVVGAVNGDFYNTGNGEPLTTQLINGEMLKNPISWWSIAFSESDKPDIGVVQYYGNVITKTGSNTLHGVNKTRDTNQLVLYNSYKGNSTGTNEWGNEFRIREISGWVVNDTVTCVVEANDTDGDMSIQTGKAVLSGHGTSDVFLTENVGIGDTIKLVLNLQPSIPRLMQLVGANVKLLSNGAYSAGSNTAIHPRTAAGFNADSTILYLVTVDGRQSASRGMSYRELADFMYSLGAKHAVNLDGGGSTTMVVLGKVENLPSDTGGERSVSNSLMTVSTAPLGGLSNIQVTPDNMRVFLGNKIDFKVTGWDQYYNQIALVSENVQYSVSPSLGSFDESGVFTASTEIDSGYAYFNYNGMTDSAYINIKTIKSIDISPKSVVTDTIQTVQFNVDPKDVDNLTPDLALSEYTWISSNPEVGTINEAGLFKATTAGSAEIVVQFKDKADTASVVVEIGEDTAVVDSMESLLGWGISGEYYVADSTTLDVIESPKTQGAGAFKLNYQFVRNADGRSWVFLSKSIPVFGLPDTIKIDIKSDLKKHIADLIISDDNGELFSVSTGLFSRETSEYVTYSLALSEFNAVETGSSFNFPIKIESIKIKLGYEGLIGDTNQGTLFIDNLRVIYPNTTTSIPLLNSQYPQRYKIYQNYPNPFNPETRIDYQIPAASSVELVIYNALGQKIRTLVHQSQSAGRYAVHWDGRNKQGIPVTSGIYFYALHAGNHLTQKKMILIR